MANLQLERQALSTKAILDFTVQRIPELPESVTRRFPELRGTAQEFDKLRINLQLQLREQFVAIRNMLDKVTTIEKLETVREELVFLIQKLQNQVTVISEVEQASDAAVNAKADVFGLVRTDKTVAVPVVYLKSTVDDLLAAIVSGTNASISALQILIQNLNGIVIGTSQYVHEQLAPANPWVAIHGQTIRPGGIRIMTTPDYREVLNVPTDDSVLGQTTITFGQNMAGIAILVFS